MATPTDSHVPAVSANGDLVNRVQQLRLGDQLGTGKQGSRGSWLPWVLCALLALSWVGVGVRWYRATGTNPDATAAGPLATANKPSGDSTAQVPLGEVVFQLKGNLIPFLQL